MAKKTKPKKTRLVNNKKPLLMVVTSKEQLAVAIGCAADRWRMKRDILVVNKRSDGSRTNYLFKYHPESTERDINWELGKTLKTLSKLPAAYFS